MRTFHHLSLLEREKLFLWHETGVSWREIARRLNRSHSSLTREYKRHTRYRRKYLPCLVQQRAFRWALGQRYQAPLKCPSIYLYVREHLREGWSPETIAGRLSLDCPGYSIDDETIYRYVYGRKQRRSKLWRYLVLHRKRRLKKDGRKVKSVGSIKGALSIELRPKEALTRQEPGHWESDNMEGKRSDRTSISASVERVTRITRLEKLSGHASLAKTNILVKQFETEGEVFKKTITLDRGPENKRHQEIAKRTGMPVYFCNPYHSWEKGTVENTIGRLRRFIPKGESVDQVTPRQLFLIQETMNDTPRKVLGFLTPNEFLVKIRSTSLT